MELYQPTIKARRCGKCGNSSESHELMQLITPLPWNGFIKPIVSEVLGGRNDILALQSLSELYLDKELEKKRQMEAVLA